MESDWPFAFAVLKLFFPLSFKRYAVQLYTLYSIAGSGPRASQKYMTQVT